MRLLHPVAAVLLLVVLAGFVTIAPGLVGASDAGAGDIEFREVGTDAGFSYETSEPSGIISDAGVYAADYDGDGWTDLLAIGAERPVLFDNEEGTFSESGQLSGVDRSIRAALFLDYDADGDQDLVLFAWDGAPVVFENDGGTLRRADGVLDAAFSQPVGATAGDYDGDGCLDLLVVQNGDWSDRLPDGSESAELAPAEDNGNPNRLFQGTCGSFEETTDDAGIRGSAWSLAASMVDLDADGRPDVHVANDFNNDVVYWNDGDGTFTRTVLPDETNRNAMASEVGDFSGDGRLDVFVTNIHLPTNVSGGVALVAENRSEGNNLLRNRGGREFSPSAERCGVRKGGWGWAAVGADLDNDGDQDLFHTTLEFTARLGPELLSARQTAPEYSYPVLFERTGEGCQFAARNVSAAGFGVTDGHGAAQLDYDRDGDVDIAMAISPGPTGDERYRLYENVGGNGEAIQVRLRGSSPSGARVSVDGAGAGAESQVRVLHSRSDYFSQDSRVLHFGVANRSTADVHVAWPDGSEQTVEDVAADTRLVVSPDGVERRIALDDSSSWLAVVDAAAAGWLPVVGLVGTGVAGGVAFLWYRRLSG
jgi:hypothetical protein